MTESVRVMVRCRPMSIKQQERNCKNVVHVDSQSQVRVAKDDLKEHAKAFSFDCVFGPDALQSYIYEQTAFSLVDNVLEGYNGTIFAYGQTGCGKTHTMMGSNDSEDNRGIIPRTFSQIITLTGVQTHKKHLVQCSFIEIYNEEIHDLLGKDIKARMDIKESPQKGVFVKDITLTLVKTVTEMEKLMEVGFKNRAVRETAMNKESSRSHSIFTIYIESSESDQLGNEKFKAGKLNLVDLAGSQRQSKTNATGDGMRQAAKINLSLSALGNVISALVDGKTQHIPYRDSKLTRLLQDSLGGNTKTIMIAAVSPADYNIDQTLSTLRYASRAKFIQNKPIVNEDPKDTLLRQYADQIKALKLLLDNHGPNVPMTFTASFSPASFRLQNQLKNKEQLLRNEQDQKQKLRGQLQNLQRIVGSSTQEVDKKEVERLKKMKEKLKLQKKKEEDWNKQRKKHDEDMLHMEHNYQSLNEEADQLRQKNMELKSRYIENLNELKDLKIQHQRERQELLDAIRNQQCEISKYSAILRMMLNNDQIEDIISKSEYDEDSREWLIVPFYCRERSVNFPKLPNKDALIAERAKKQIVFKEALPPRPPANKLRVHEVLKGARESNSNSQTSAFPGISETVQQIRQQQIKSEKRAIFKNTTLVPLKSESQQNIRYEDGGGTIYSKVKLSPLDWQNHQRRVGRP